MKLLLAFTEAILFTIVASAIFIIYDKLNHSDISQVLTIACGILLAFRCILKSEIR